MKKIAIALAAAALGLSASAAAAAPASDKAQIEALEARFAAAFNAKDVAGIMANYAKDGLFVFDVTPPRQHVGWDDYRKDWEGFLGAEGAVKFTLSDLDVTVVGPVAYGHRNQTIHAAGKDGGPAADLVVRVTDVYRKLAGKWLIVQEHVSVPVDLDTGKGDLASKP